MIEYFYNPILSSNLTIDSSQLTYYGDTHVVSFGNIKSDQSPTCNIVFLCSALYIVLSLQWRHNERDGVSNHQPHDCLLNRLFKSQMTENIKAPRHCEGNSPVTAQNASNAENVSMWWRHHAVGPYLNETTVHSTKLPNISRYLKDIAFLRRWILKRVTMCMSYE